METLQSVRSKLRAVNKDVSAFLDVFVDDKSFVETDALMCSSTEFGDATGEGVISGIAQINNNAVAIFATNAAVFKGAIGALGAKKIIRTVNNALSTRKPLIAVWDTSGARIAEGIECLEGYSDMLRAFAIAHEQVPVISIIKGNNLGISAYLSEFSDFVLACPEAVSATASPLVLSAKAGVPESAVGGAKVLAERGIVTNIVKKNEIKGLLNKILDIFCGNEVRGGDDLNRVCKGLKAGSNCSAVIKQVVDKDTFFEVRENFASVVKTGFAMLADTYVGIVAVDGAVDGGRLTVDACIKIERIIETCENAEIPVIFFVDSVGTAQSGDDTALIREMARLIYNVNLITVDLHCVIFGKAIGGAYSALVSPCDYKLAWENAELGVMESEAAARLEYADEIKSAKDKDKAAAKFAAAYASENSNAVYVARGGKLDNVIEPNLTRSYLISALLARVE